MLLGFFLGAVPGMAAVSAMTAMNPPNRGGPGALLPLVFSGGAALGLFAGRTIGLVLDFRHAARAEDLLAMETTVGIGDR